MDKVMFQNRRIPVVMLFFIVFAGLFYTNSAQATMQLAYFIGHDDYYGSGYNRPTYVYHGYLGAGWTKWKYSGHGCQQRCMIDRWSGKVIRCQRRC